MSVGGMRRINLMDWDALLHAIAQGKAEDLPESELREYFGDEEYANLKQMARHAGATRGGVLGNVIVIPGIMGSYLDAEEDGDDDNIWMNFFRIAMGRVEDLKLAASGTAEANSNIKVSASGADKKTYAPLVLYLKRRWNVEVCPFDWRRHIDEASTKLAELIADKFDGQPVQIVAHSMGGLVARNFIRMYPKVWETMTSAGGRLIMLGTPNYGSFAIPQVLTGKEPMIGYLHRMDFRHDLRELLEITNTFIGSYLMLPAPHKLPADTQAIYSAGTWQPWPVSQLFLDRAREFHDRLLNGNTVDGSRMVYVAGYGRDTLCRLKIIAAGKFEYFTTQRGDGRVPHTLGLLDGVPTYYIEETHGTLPRNQQVMEAIDQLLAEGTTPLLLSAIPAERALAREEERALPESETHGELGDVLERLSAQVNVASRGGAKLDPDELPNSAEMIAAGEALMRVAMGADDPAQPLKKLRLVGKKKRRRAGAVKLEVHVLHGDVTRANLPVAVGHYRGVAPAAAEGTLDIAFDRAISQAVSSGMFRGELGELFHIPRPRGIRQAPPAVIVAGMGEFGTFGRDDLHFLMKQVTLACNKLGLNEFATVLIGSGKGNLTRDRAVRGLMEGVCDALDDIPRAGRHVRRLIIIELFRETAREIKEWLDEMKRENSLPEIALTIKSSAMKTADRDEKKERARRQKAVENQDGQAQENRVRILIEREGETFRFSALTDSAVVPVREESLQSCFIDGAARGLIDSFDRTLQERYGHMFYQYMLPEDFQKLLEPDVWLTLVLDRRTAGLPWEMACFKSATGMHFFGPHLGLSRQFRTTLSSVGHETIAAKESLRALVIADPAPEQELRLLGARKEGEAVVKALQKSGRIEVVRRIGPEQCDPAELLAQLLTQRFDIIHFSGHGFFDQQSPDRGGWVLGRGKTLTPREIFKSPRNSTRLVFANACYSAVINPSIPPTGMMRGVAGIAEAFLERGVSNYIGAGWPVNDLDAVAFAEKFHEALLKGQTIGDALKDARVALLNSHPGSTWGAYQHYGCPWMKLFKPTSD